VWLPVHSLGVAYAILVDGSFDDQWMQIVYRTWQNIHHDGLSLERDVGTVKGPGVCRVAHYKSPL
jgi:hypothetical protein